MPDRLPDNLRSLAVAARARLRKLPATAPIDLQAATAKGDYLDAPYEGEDWELYACLILDAFGTRSFNVANAFMQQLAALCPDVWVGGEERRLDPYRFELALDVVCSLKPRNSAESALCVQAVAIHLASMRVGSALSNRTGTDPHSASSLAQLTKAYAKVLDTLANLRGRKSSRQTIKVLKTVNVNTYRDEKHIHLASREGGQNNGNRPCEPRSLRARARGAQEPGGCASLPSQVETFGEVVPLSRRAG